MSDVARKFVAVFLMLWLPLFSMSAVAMVACPHSMNAGDSGADTMRNSMLSSVIAPDMDGMADMDATEHSAHLQQHDHHSQPTSGQMHDCGQCGVCHIACSPGLVSTAAQIVVNVVPADSMPVNTRFLSITLPIFDPPPLVLI